MKEILLTKNKVAMVDDEDFEVLSKWSWYAHPGINNFYAARGTMLNYKNKLYLMHRQIMEVSDPSILIDHIDGNGLNNQRSNLRICTVSTNSFNKRLRHNSTSGFKGVSWNSEKKKWHVKCNARKKTLRVGYYQDKIEAALAYNVTASFAHGEFANLNKI